jgi:hypothetical protein
MKKAIATLLLAGASFAAMAPVHAAPANDGHTPVVCVTDGCTDGGPGKPRR